MWVIAVSFPQRTKLCCMMNEWMWWFINWLRIPTILAKYICNWYVQFSFSGEDRRLLKCLQFYLPIWDHVQFTQCDLLENKYCINLYCFGVQLHPFSDLCASMPGYLMYKYISYYLFRSVPQDNMKFLMLHENKIKRMLVFLCNTVSVSFSGKSSLLSLIQLCVAFCLCN